MSSPKSQHTLPRFYLSGFCDREIHVRENHERDRSRCRVWVHDKEQDCVRQRGVKKLTTETHFYSLDAPGGGQDAAPEEVLSRLEGAAAPIIKSLYFGRVLSREEVEILAVFFASMKFRIGAYRPFAHRHVEENRERIKARAFPNPEVVERALRRDEHVVAEDPEAVRRIFREARYGPMALNLTKNHNIGHMFDHSRKVAQVLLTQDWTFAWAPRGATFATSDDPVLLLGPDLEAPESYWGDLGFASPDATEVLPLTQRVCLVVGSGAPSVGHARLDEDGVRSLNTQQTRHYVRWLIAGKKELAEDLVEPGRGRLCGNVVEASGPGGGRPARFRGGGSP